MKLSFVTTMAGHSWGGSEELWLKLAHDALEEKYEVECSIFNWDESQPKVKQLQSEGAKIRKRTRFKYPELYKKPWGKLKEIIVSESQLTNHLKKSDFALVSMGGFCDLEVNAFRKPLLHTNTPYSIVIHANPENTYLGFNKIAEIITVCKNSHRVYFVSHRLKEIAIRQTGYSFPNGELIINPVNMEEIGVLPYPDTSVFQMACVGRLNAKVKGQALLLHCLATEKWKNRAWHLNIYGKGNDLNYLQWLVKKFELSGKVSFHGHVHDIRQDIWTKNHVLLMPSYYEGMPIALVEAMLSGRTAVVTDVGGNAELLEDNVSGFIAKGVNKGAFQEALERAWLKRLDWKEIGMYAFEKAKRYFYDTPFARHIDDILPK